MKIKKAIIATSHRDSHGEILHPEGLKFMVEEINKKYLRVGVEHDPRIPPIGRIVGAKLILLDDGEYAVESESEIFENEDNLPLTLGSKEMVSHKNEKGKLFIKYDRSFKDDGKIEIVNEIAALFQTKPVEEVKKALEPLSILIIGGGFILSSVAAGFLGKLGSDVYDALKNKIKKLFNKNFKDSHQEQLLIFEFTVYSEESSISINVNVILTNPNEDEIESFLSTDITKIDELIACYYNVEVGISEIFIEYKEKELKVIYGIRTDVVPLYPKN